MSRKKSEQINYIHIHGIYFGLPVKVSGAIQHGLPWSRLIIVFKLQTVPKSHTLSIVPPFISRRLFFNSNNILVKYILYRNNLFIVTSTA